MKSENHGVGVVTKQVFNSTRFELVNGSVLENLVLGFETYGSLNPAGDNAILIPHYFTGTSHCAGRYSDADVEAGYWDSIIGPGRAIDTERFFVVGIDSLCNINVRDPRVTTTGPASVDPATGKPYGLRFPLVRIQDFVRSQRLVLESLGVRRLNAVCGPSMGALQALEWAATFPEMVERVIAAIPGTLDSDPYLIARIGSWMMPILHDPNWKNGDYDPNHGPETGLTDSLRLITIDALHYEWARRTFGHRRQDIDRDPAASFENRFAVDSGIDEVARARAQIADANSLLYLAKTVQTFSLKSRIAAIRARVLCLPAQSDLLLFPRYAEETARTLQAAGVQVESQVLEGGGGHLDGLHSIAQAGERIRRFLET